MSRSIVDEISRALEQINKDLDDAMLRSKEVESTSDVIEPVQVVPLINNRVDDHDENAIDNSSSHSGGDDDDMHSSHVALDVSHRLRARLLNICGSVAFLLGDAVGAVKCFRASIQQDDLLLDLQVKLGSLLVDMDELKEVGGCAAVDARIPHMLWCVTVVNILFLCISSEAHHHHHSLITIMIISIIFIN